MDHFNINDSLIDKIVCEVKSQGAFDQFRRECIADVDTKPAYQNLRQRVENSVATFLKDQQWKADLNKNQLRDRLRRNITESGFLETGVERIVDQVVNPKINSVFLPTIEDISYKFLGIEKPKAVEQPPLPPPLPTSHHSHSFPNEFGGGVPSTNGFNFAQLGQHNNNNILPNDLEAVSPESEDRCHPNKSMDSSILSNDADNVNTSIESGGNTDGHPNDAADKSLCDDFESPAFEPLEGRASSAMSLVNDDEDDGDNSKISAISGLTSQDSIESCIDHHFVPQHPTYSIDDLSRIPPPPPPLPPPPPPPEDPPLEPKSEPTPPPIDEHLHHHLHDPNSALSQVSSNSRLTIVTNNDSKSVSMPGDQHCEEAQMPKFNENSSNSHNANTGNVAHTSADFLKDRKPLLTSFDIKQDEIMFEGTRRHSICLDIKAEAAKQANNPPPPRTHSPLAAMPPQPPIDSPIPPPPPSDHPDEDVGKIESFCSTSLITSETKFLSLNDDRLEEEEEEEDDGEEVPQVAAAAAIDASTTTIDMEFKFEEPAIDGTSPKDHHRSRDSGSHKSRRRDRSSGSSKSHHSRSKEKHRRDHSEQPAHDSSSHTRDKHHSTSKARHGSSSSNSKDGSGGGAGGRSSRHSSSSSSHHRRDDKTTSKSSSSHSVRSSSSSTSKHHSSHSAHHHSHHSSSSNNNKERSSSLKSSSSESNHQKRSTSRSDKVPGEEQVKRKSTTDDLQGNRTDKKSNDDDDDGNDANGDDHFSQKHIDERRSSNDSNDGNNHPRPPRSIPPTTTTTTHPESSASIDQGEDKTSNENHTSNGSSSSTIDDSSACDHLAATTTIAPSLQLPFQTHSANESNDDDDHDDNDDDFVLPQLPIVVDDQILNGCQEINLELLIRQETSDPVLSSIQQTLSGLDGSRAHLKKPKVASNIHEARKLMKVRKQMERDEKKRIEQAIVLAKKYISTNSELAISLGMSDDQGVELEFACVTSSDSPAPSISSPNKIVSQRKQNNEPFNPPAASFGSDDDDVDADDHEFFGFEDDDSAAQERARTFVQYTEHIFSDCAEFLRNHSDYARSIYLFNADKPIVTAFADMIAGDVWQYSKNAKRHAVVLRPIPADLLIHPFHTASHESDVNSSPSKCNRKRHSESSTSTSDNNNSSSSSSGYSSKKQRKTTHIQYAATIQMTTVHDDGVDVDDTFDEEEEEEEDDDDVRSMASDGYASKDVVPNANVAGATAIIHISPTPSDHSFSSKENSFVPKIKKAVSRSIAHNSTINTNRACVVAPLGCDDKATNQQQQQHQSQQLRTTVVTTTANSKANSGPTGGANLTTPSAANKTSQRYSSDDLYKPRPILLGSRSRRRGGFDTSDL